MSIEQLLADTQHQLQQTQWPEALAVIFGVLSVLLASRNRVWLYPTGLISTGIYTWLMLDVKLYAESSLNAYYFIMSVYGWIAWTRRKGTDEAVHITASNSRDWIIASIIAFASLGGLYLLLHHFTDSAVPLWDAAVSALAYAGMWLLARHKVENWLWLNASNALAVPLYFVKGIPFTALLTIFLFIVAIFGYLKWRRIYLQSLEPLAKT